MLLLLMCFLGWQSETGKTFRNLSSDEGLSQNTVWTFAQDGQGLMWIGTNFGLNRFDGYQFKLKGQSVPHGLSSMVIRSMAVGEDGSIWIGANLGFYRMNPATEEITEIPISQENKDVFISSIVARNDSGFWLGTSEGLCLMKADGSLVHMDFASSSAQPPHNAGLRQLMLDRKGRLWAATRNGVHVLNEEAECVEHWLEGGSPKGLSAEFMICLAEDDRGAIWAGSSNGLNRIDPDSGDVEHIYFDADQTGIDRVSSVLYDGSGSIWVGTIRDGLVRIDLKTGEKTYFLNNGNPGDIAGNDITTLFLDETNLLWIGVYGQGFSLLDIKPQRVSRLNETLRDVQAIFEDEQSRLWVGRQQGILRFDPDGSTRVYTQDGSPGSLTENHVNTIHGRGGLLLAGLYGGGVNLYNPETDRFSLLEQLPVDDDSVIDQIFFTVFIDSKIRIWAGTYRGLELFDEEKGGFLPFPKHSWGRRVQAIHEDHLGRIWVGTESNGLFLIDPAREMVFPKGQNNPSRRFERINAIRHDDQGHLWIGTMSGLCRYDEEADSFINYEEAKGASICSIYGILPVDNALWLGSSEGLLRVEESNGAMQKHFFDKGDGVASYDFFRGAVLETRDGRLLFGGSSGIDVIHSSRLVINRTPPKLAFTSFKVFDSETPINDSIKLSYRQNHFSFEFAALDYHASWKNKYAYKLDGFDSEWVESGHRNYTSYTNLPYGSYVFRVRGTNNDGTWNERGISIPVTIRPPYWLETWFIALIVFALILIAIGIHLSASRALQKRNRDLEALIDQKTGEMDSTRQNLLNLAHRSGIYDITHGVMSQIQEQIAVLAERVEKISLRLSANQIQGLRGVIKNLESICIPGQEPDREKAEKIVNVLFALERILMDQRSGLEHVSISIINHINLMRDTISTQHGYAKAHSETERIDICDLVDDALQLEKRPESEAVDIRRYYRSRPQIRLPRIKLIHVLSQVIRNAFEAMEQMEQPTLGIYITSDESHVSILIADTGPGIPVHLRKRVFESGFSTKADRAGFGLYSSARIMDDLGGSIEIGAGKDDRGAVMTLKVPIHSIDMSLMAPSGDA